MDSYPLLFFKFLQLFVLFVCFALYWKLSFVILDWNEMAHVFKEFKRRQKREKSSSWVFTVDCTQRREHHVFVLYLFSSLQTPNSNPILNSSWAGMTKRKKQKQKKIKQQKRAWETSKLIWVLQLRVEKSEQKPENKQETRGINK